jgi:hypothetical protein
MDTSGVQTPGASYFEGIPIQLGNGPPEGWHDAPSLLNLRFLVYGTALRAVPEPATITSLASALVVGLAVLACRRSRRRTQPHAPPSDHFVA